MVREIQQVTLSNGICVPAMLMAPGTNICLTGASNSGKSEYCLYALGYPKQTTIFSTAPLPDPQKVGYVPTTPQNLFSGMKSTLKGELELTYQFLGQEIGEYDELVKILGLNNQLNQDPFTLSGGEAVKAAIAIVAAKRPSHWILDQVYDALAPNVREQIRSFFEHELLTGASIIETHSRAPKWVHKCQKCVFLRADGQAIVGKYEELPHHEIPVELLRPETQLIQARFRQLDEPRKASDDSPAKAIASVFDHSLAKKRGGVRVEGIQFQHKNSNFRLGPIDLSCAPGECLALIGPNGAGKTTLLKLIAGLLKPSGGSIQIGGDKPKNAFSWASNILYCFQNPDDQLYLARVSGELYSTSKILRRRADQPKWIIDSLELGDLMDRSPAELPISTRRLITIASAFIAAPPFIALDEPTATLDSTQSKNLLKVMRKYINEGGGVCLISHDYDFVGEIADRLVCLSDGKIEAKFHPHSWPIEYAPFALKVTLGTTNVTCSLQELIKAEGDHHLSSRT